MFSFLPSFLHFLLHFFFSHPSGFGNASRRQQVWRSFHDNFTSTAWLCWSSRSVRFSSSGLFHPSSTQVSKGCYEVRGKTLGIIGYGHVGSQLSVLSESLGMRVIFYDVRPVLPLGNAVAVRSMEEVLTRADFVSVHVPLLPTTQGLIGAKVHCVA